jgi:hypothetical protein
MSHSPRSDDAALDHLLRDEAQRDRPAFDLALHRRTVARLHDAAPMRATARTPWPRYAVAATLLLAAGVMAVAGSGWLRDRVNQREDRRRALAAVTAMPPTAVGTLPLRALDSAELLAQTQWSRLDHDVRQQVDHVQAHWAWQFLFVGRPVPDAMPGADPSENVGHPDPPAGV